MMNQMDFWVTHSSTFKVLLEESKKVCNNYNLMDFFKETIDEKDRLLKYTEDELFSVDQELTELKEKYRLLELKSNLKD